jgi:DNA replication licensing factor MCM6
MSSIADAILTSDGPAPYTNGAARRNGRSATGSSPRPQGPPSESNGALSDVEGFPDDEVVGIRGDRNRPRNPLNRAIPRVTDEVGERVADVFEEFLEK